jgi:hypothetical protein
MIDTDTMKIEAVERAIDCDATASTYTVQDVIRWHKPPHATNWFVRFDQGVTAYERNTTKHTIPQARDEYERVKADQLMKGGAVDQIRLVRMHVIDHPAVWCNVLQHFVKNSVYAVVFVQVMMDYPYGEGCRAYDCQHIQTVAQQGLKLRTITPLGVVE